MTDHSAGATPAGVQFTFRACLVVGAVLPFVPTMLDQRPSDLLAAASLLLIASGCLLLQVARGPHAEWVGFGAPASAAGPGILVLGITLFPAGMFLIAAPLEWMLAVWSGVPAGTGLLPSRYPLEAAFAPHQAAAVAIAAAAAGVLGYAVRQEWRAVVHGFGLILPVALPLELAATGTGWPAITLALLAIGTGLTLAAAVADLGPWRRTFAGCQGFAYLAAATATSLAVPATTLLALTVMTTAAAWAGWNGRAEARVPAWILTVLLAAATGATAGLAAGLPREQAAFGVLVAAVAALALGAAIHGIDRKQSAALAVAAQLAMVGALIMSAGSLAAAKLLCAAFTVAVGLRVLWPGTSTSDRRFRAVSAAAWLTLTYWLVIGAPQDNLNEVYTLPVAGVALLAGWAARRRWRTTKARTAYGPAVALAILPTLQIAADTADGRRWAGLALAVLVGVGAVLILRRRRPRVLNGI